MTRPSFPRRAGIAAAMVAVAMSFTFARPLSAQGGPGSSFITAHNFFDGFTDIPFSGVGDILSLNGAPGAMRVIFDHSGPLSYDPNTLVLSVQAGGGVFEDFSGVVGKVNISAYVDHTGTLIKDGAFYTCGDGDPASFCVQAPDRTVLLRGNVKGFAFRYNAGQRIDAEYQQPYDDFAFYIQLIGGSLKTQYGNFIAVSVHSFSLRDLSSNLIYGPQFAGSFEPPNPAPNPLPTCLALDADGLLVHTAPGCSFAGGILGVFGISAEYGFLLDRCNGVISGGVLNALTAAPLQGDEISVIGGDLVNPEARTTDFNGQYAFSSSALHATGLCAGTYTVRADVPDGFAPGDLYPTTRTVTFNIDSAGNDVPSVAGSNVVNFRFYPVISTDFKTFGQGAWGARPRGNNAGMLLQDYYVVPYGTDPVVIGSAANNKYVSMSGPLAVQNFLPQGGRPVPLDGPYSDPIVKVGHHKPHNRLGSLAGETLALQLNVDFSNASLTRFGLGSLYVAFGPLKNCTVNQVLAHGNSVLGGGPLVGSMKYDDVEDTMEMINQNYQGGRSKGYLLVSPSSTPTCKVP